MRSQVAVLGLTAQVADLFFLTKAHGRVLAIIRRKEVDLPRYQGGFDACWLLIYGLWQASSFFDFDYNRNTGTSEFKRRSG